MRRSSFPQSDCLPCVYTRIQALRQLWELTALGPKTSLFCVVLGLCQNSSLMWQWSCKHQYQQEQSGGNCGAGRGGQTPLLEKKG